MTTKIPTIDFSLVSQLGWKNLSSDQWQLLTEQVYEAICQVGFMTIVNHGIEQNKIDAAFKESSKFFTSPTAIKESHKIDKTKAFRGYTNPGNFIPETSLPVFESFFVEFPDPLYKIDEVPDFILALEELRTALQPIAQALLWLTGKCLKLDDDQLFLKAYNKGQSDRGQQSDVNVSTMRCNYYNGVPEGIHLPKDFVRGVEHKDWGNYTLLFQDDVGGLEVKSMDGTWIPAVPTPGSILVNTGQVLDTWTGGVFPATPHRILLPESDVKKRMDRQSVVFFVNTDNDTLISPLKSELISYEGKQFEPILFKDYYDNLLNNSYKK